MFELTFSFGLVFFDGEASYSIFCLSQMATTANIRLAVPMLQDMAARGVSCQPPVKMNISTPPQIMAISPWKNRTQTHMDVRVLNTGGIFFLLSRVNGMVYFTSRSVNIEICLYNLGKHRTAITLENMMQVRRIMVTPLAKVKMPTGEILP